MKIGCLNKITNQTEYIYHSTRFKSLPAPYGKEPYVQYEIQDGTTPDQYIWDTDEVIIDPNYVPPTPDYVSIGMDAVRNAVEFGQNMIIKFAGQNIALGITQVGKTKEVADYLSDVTRYIQTGSLYEVVSEIDRLISVGIPAELSPFVTETRLTEFKQEIMDYLT